eukprot:NODE_6078_length_373_cov_470.243827_g5359_i0.p2 GENE.NODE_6078_length_373_cov_470.243827_g5359_i0~~NODE_6078_length_373_cov_470.243827_g5359_i0.p2  ORF type:complete len:59 (+),score=14.30 NODE_6078_length_373_cov_470.243827_g5359_i0:57-233(+)
MPTKKGQAQPLPKPLKEELGKFYQPLQDKKDLLKQENKQLARGIHRLNSSIEHGVAMR